MEDIKELKNSLKEVRPNKWEDIPDIDLYMDQVLVYMQRQHIGLESGETLTSAMVNNYIKKGLLPRAKGKRYDRTHVAYLTAICLMKQVLSVDLTDQMLKNQLENSGIQEFYRKYCESVDNAYNEVAEKISEDMSKEEISELVLQLAASSYAQKVACERLLEIQKTK
ncbi:DUF1836 domain-containing protein [Clostridium aminobutyricum]|uniref:DUF1836 domain-containing protein n=1 Tax=Clostridium aminobutyricum TaxID=33953 RepID=A0A939DA08_CLOAM|nr:DUF1836 domain-containing protein [Clostridium aminobutyricum]MBN7773463.1 DUF1836 domain-containing protein [Clostridium aminobutyricum]